MRACDVLEDTLVLNLLVCVLDEGLALKCLMLVDMSGWLGRWDPLNRVGLVTPLMWRIAVRHKIRLSLIPLILVRLLLRHHIGSLWWIDGSSVTLEWVWLEIYLLGVVFLTDHYLFNRWFDLIEV